MMTIDEMQRVSDILTDYNTTLRALLEARKEIARLESKLVKQEMDRKLKTDARIASTEPSCFLCQSTGPIHSIECNATPLYSVDLDQGPGWRAGVKAAKKVYGIQSPSNHTEE